MSIHQQQPAAFSDAGRGRANRLPALAAIVPANASLQGLEVDARAGGQIDVSGLTGVVPQTGLIYEDHGVILLPEVWR
ncbi:MAG: hypothetical protein H7A47_01925 [Verrucomicrobiales bacterium]|nr:hypothetical protein [Verrucomicrobiales bacterium]